MVLNWQKRPQTILKVHVFFGIRKYYGLWKDTSGQLLLKRKSKLLKLSKWDTCIWMPAIYIPIPVHLPTRSSSSISANVKWWKNLPVPGLKPLYRLMFRVCRGELSLSLQNLALSIALPWTMDRTGLDYQWVWVLNPSGGWDPTVSRKYYSFSRAVMFPGRKQKALLTGLWWQAILIRPR